MTHGYDRTGNKVRTAAEKSSLLTRLGLESGDISHGYAYKDRCDPALELSDRMDALAATVTTRAGQKGMILFYKSPKEAAMFGVEVYEFGPDGAIQLDKGEIDIGTLPAELKPGNTLADTHIMIEEVAGFTEEPISVDTVV